MCCCIRHGAPIQDGYARTTPGKAVGFLFIPFYNIYWLFQAIYGFAIDHNSYAERHSLSVRRLPSGHFLAFCFLIFGFVLMFVPVLGLLYWVGFLLLTREVYGGIYDAVNALASGPQSAPVRSEAGTPVSPSPEAGLASKTPVPSASPGDSPAASLGPAATRPAPMTTASSHAEVQPSASLKAQPTPARPDTESAVGAAADVPLEAPLELMNTLKGGLKLAGVLNIVTGIIGILTVLGAPVGLVLILIGASALRTSGRAQDYLDTRDARTLAGVARRLRTYMLTSSIVFLVGVLGIGAAVVYAGVTAATGLLPYTLKYLAMQFNDWAAMLMP